MTRALSVRCRFLPRFETLEDRTLLSTCHVNRLTDVGVGNGFRGDLRYCLNKVNALPGPDQINVRVSGNIYLTGTLPDLSDDVTIKGPGREQMIINGQGATRVFHVNPGVNVLISNIAVTNGLADLGGGILNEGNLTLDYARITSNVSSAGKGGGIYNSGTLAVLNSRLADNDALTDSDLSRGGGIYNAESGVTTVEYSTIAGNRATGSSAHWAGGGGGISNAGTLTVRYTTIAENQAISAPSGVDWSPVRVHGGGIYNTGTMIVEGTTVWANSSTIAGTVNLETPFVSGGGIYSTGTATVRNSTIVENHATGPSGYSVGGGIFNHGTITIHHATIARNYASNPDAVQGGGVIAGGITHLHNSIVAENYLVGGAIWGAYGPDLDCHLTSSGYNVIGDSSTGGAYGDAGYHYRTDLLDVDPMLGELTNNGGPTMTIGLLPDSPAIDAGDNTDAPDWDQRGPGATRIVNNTIDIGAYEVQATGAPSTKLAVLLTADFSRFPFRSKDLD